jgi:hypothetical protein
MMVEINSDTISKNVRFVFDHPFAVSDQDIFELKNGQWYLIRNNIATLMEGKWDRLKQ